MEEKKFLGMPKKVCLGLGWLTLVIAIVGLAVEHQKMTKEEKQQFVSVFVGYVFVAIAVTIFSIVGAIVAAAGAEIGWLFSLLNFLAWAVMLVCMIFAFINEDFKAPVFYNIAGNFVKDGEEPKEEKAAEPSEESKEE